MLRFQNPDLESESRIKNTNLEHIYIVHLPWNSLGNHLMHITSCCTNSFPRYGKFKETHVPVLELEHRIQNTTLESGCLVHLTYNSIWNHLMSNISCYD